MSYDISIKVNTGKDWYEVEEVGNYTYNVGNMYYTAFGESITEALHDKLCKHVHKSIKTALEYMRENKEDLKKMNPENGWGNYEGAIEYLSRIEDAVYRHPKGKIVIS